LNNLAIWWLVNLKIKRTTRPVTQESHNHPIAESLISLQSTEAQPAQHAAHRRLHRSIDLARGFVHGGENQIL